MAERSSILDAAPNSTIQADQLELEAGQAYLVVMGTGPLQRVPLAGRTELIVGRAEDADVHLVDPLSSRQHAALHIGRVFEIEDLGSANGTRLGQAQLLPRTRYEVKCGETIVIGSTTLIVQRSQTLPPAQRLFQHDYFEARLDEECDRARSMRSEFNLVRLSIAGEHENSAGDWLVSEVPPEATVGLFGHNEYELIVPSEAAEVSGVLECLVREAARRKLVLRYGSAAYPVDGVKRESLQQAASLSLHGPPSASGAFVVRDPAMQRLHQLARQVAVGTISVLLLGETGTGKEVLAHTIHASSGRSSRAFLRLNCAAFNDTLIESELFGHERGAFTGAVQAKPGLLEMANGGTVFLDELAELSLATQAKLLRAIETREVLRVGGLKPINVDVRFVAATNKNLEEEVAYGRFRQDLYFRLNGVILNLPPLRERLSEIEELVQRFAREVAEQLKKPCPTVARSAMAALCSYAWPGNIRELRNTIERAVLLSRGASVEVEDLPMERMMLKVSAPASAEDAAGERERIERALRDCAGNQTRAAALLGISRRTLVNRLGELGIARPHK
jgi:two-component system, NtrC family, response regulator AtoC